MTSPPVNHEEFVQQYNSDSKLLFDSITELVQRVRSQTDLARSQLTAANQNTDNLEEQINQISVDLNIARAGLTSTATTFNDTSNTDSVLSTSLDENIMCYVLPNNASREAILDAAFACALACTSELASLSQWKNLLVTYTNILIPGIIKTLPRRLVKTVRITASNMTRLRNIFSDVQESTKPQDYQIAPDSLNNFCLDGVLPKPRPDVAVNNITYCRKEKTLFAHFSLVVFLAGKFVNDSNRTSITTARPRALIEKFQIAGTLILNGSARISDHGHLFIHQAYLEMSSFTAECFKEFSKYNNSPINMYQDIINVNVKLLRFANMQHAAIINKFLESYPWAADMIELKQSFSVYANSVKTLCSLKPSLQPYVKLIYGDKSGVFPRKEMGPLIACAVEIEKETNITLQNYYFDDQYQEVVERFRQFRQLKYSETVGNRV